MRNADADPGRRVRKVRDHLPNSRIEPLAENAAELVIFPPGLHDVMIRENRSLPDDKPGAEEVGPHLRRAAFQRVDRIAVAVFQRLAVAGDAGVSQRSSRGMVKEYDRNVEQANARRVRANHLFRGLRFRFDPPQAIVGLLKLLAERRDFFASSARDFLPQLF